MLNIKQFLDLYKWADIEYRANINKNNYALFEKSNPEIALIMLYIDINLEILNWTKDYMLYINQSNNHRYLIVTMKEKKGNFVINFPCYIN